MTHPISAHCHMPAVFTRASSSLKNLNARFKTRTVSIAKTFRSGLNSIRMAPAKGGKWIAEKSRRVASLFNSGQKGFVYGTVIGQYSGIAIGAAVGAAIGSTAGPLTALAGAGIGALTGFGVGMIGGGAGGTAMLVGLNVRAKNKEEKAAYKQEFENMKAQLATKDTATL